MHNLGSGGRGGSITVPSDMAPGFARLQGQFRRINTLVHCVCMCITLLFFCSAVLTLAVWNVTSKWGCVVAGGNATSPLAGAIGL